MAKAYLTGADLIAGIALKPVDFDVEGLGWVQVRGLTMAELGELQATYENQPVELLLQAARIGLVEPKLTDDEFAAFRQGNPAYVSQIGTRVFELSGRGDKDKQDPLVGSGS